MYYARSTVCAVHTGWVLCGENNVHCHNSVHTMLYHVKAGFSLSTEILTWECVIRAGRGRTITTIQSTIRWRGSSIMFSFPGTADHRVWTVNLIVVGVCVCVCVCMCVCVCVCVQAMHGFSP